MDLIIDLLVLIAVIYGIAQKAKKNVSEKKRISQHPKRKIRSNQKSSLERNEAGSAFDSLSHEEWKRYGENIFTEYYKAEQESSLRQEIKREEEDIKKLENQTKNTIEETQIEDVINKSEIGNLKLSFDRNKIIEALIMAEILGKPKALKK